MKIPNHQIVQKRASICLSKPIILEKKIFFLTHNFFEDHIELSTFRLKTSMEFLNILMLNKQKYLMV